MKEEKQRFPFAGKFDEYYYKAATCGLNVLMNKQKRLSGKLKTYEEKAKYRKISEEDNYEKLLFHRQRAKGMTNNMNATMEMIEDEVKSARGRGQGRFAKR
ncbi:hypothetical protein Tco_1569311 [Tanacetum coccineum]